jgi:hypothetical protein
MKTRNLLLIVCAVLGIASICPAASVREKRDVTGQFRQINSSSGIAVHFTQGGAVKIEVEAEEDVIKNIITELRGETLVVKFKPGAGTKWNFRFNSSSVNVYVTAPELSAIEISGGARFNAERINSASFSISQSGGARSNISGLALSGKISISTSGGAAAVIESLECSGGELSTSGGASITAKVKCSGEIEASASGGARITLSGNAKTVEASASGGASVNIGDLSSDNVNSSSSGGGRVRK